MNGKQGEAELLRGIIDGCKADGERRCYDKAKLFGIDCAHEMMENERLKKENDDLKAELADWKGNAEGFQPDAYMKLPLDADGEPIRVGDVLYSSGNECRVVNITVNANEVCVAVYADDGTFFPWINPKYLSRKKPEPADSWEKLEEDMMRGTSCLYFRGVESALKCCDCPHGIEQTGTLCWKNERIDILKRAKKLAKAGEVE